MIWETTISHIIVDRNGNDKVIKRKHLTENQETFGEVEELLFKEFGNEPDFQVCVIKISKLKEIINEKPQGDDDCRIYFATIVDKFYDVEKDETSEMKYTVALFAHDISEAHQAVRQYMSQGLEDMELEGLKTTKIEDVIR